MLIPALITAGVLGALVLSRETALPEPSASVLDAEMTQLGQAVVSAPTSVDPGRLDALANHLRKAGRNAEAATVEAWAVYVRAVKRGVQPPQLPPGLPVPSSSTSPLLPAPPIDLTRSTYDLPPELAARATQLLSMGAAASPFALESLANEIDTMSPGHLVVNALRRQADMNRGLVPPMASPMMPGPTPPSPAPPVQGLPYPYGRVAGMPSPAQVFAPFATFAPLATPFVQQTPFVTRPAVAPPIMSVTPPEPPESNEPMRRRMRCTDPAGCSLYRTPASLYPTGASVPSGTAAYVEREEGPWVYVRFGTQQGWAPRASFTTEFRPAAPAFSPVGRHVVPFR